MKYNEALASKVLLEHQVNISYFFEACCIYHYFSPRVRSEFFLNTVNCIVYNVHVYYTACWRVNTPTTVLSCGVLVTRFLRKQWQITSHVFEVA